SRSTSGSPINSTLPSCPPHPRSGRFSALLTRSIAQVHQQRTAPFTGRPTDRYHAVPRWDSGDQVGRAPDRALHHSDRCALSLPDSLGNLTPGLGGAGVFAPTPSRLRNPRGAEPGGEESRVSRIDTAEHRLAPDRPEHR